MSDSIEILGVAEESSRDRRYDARFGSRLAAAQASVAAIEAAVADLPSRTLTAGDGLTGGGDLSADRTFDVDSTVVRTSGNQTIGGTKTFSAAVVLSTAGTTTSHAVRADRSIASGDGLSGGGNLTSDRTFAVDSSVIRTSGSQSMSGTKTFTGTLRSQGTNVDGGGTTRTGRTVLGPAQASGGTRTATITTALLSSSRTYTFPNVSGEVILSAGNQTIGGIKTFTGNITMANNTSLRQSSTSTWSGNPGSGVGKIEYHSNRWYIVAGSNSTELLRVRRNNADQFVIGNTGIITTGTIPWGQVTSQPSTLSGTVNTSGNQTIAGTKTFSSTIAGSINGNAASATVLATARTINGVSFNGSANITLPTVNTSGNQTVNGRKSFTTEVRFMTSGSGHQFRMNAASSGGSGTEPTLDTTAANFGFIGRSNRRIFRGFAGAWLTGSDRKDKGEIIRADLDECYEKVRSMELHRYSRNRDRDNYYTAKGEAFLSGKDFKDPGHPRWVLGIMAEDAPDEVADEDHLNIDVYAYASLIAGAVKVLQRKVENLESAVA